MSQLSTLLRSFFFLICLLSIGASVLWAQQDIVKDFRHHYIDSDPERPFAATFLGVPMMQNPADMWMFQEIITEIQPDIIIECGTAYGGGTVYLATMLEQVNPNGKVITIDLSPGLEGSVSRLKNRPGLYRRLQQLLDDRIEIITSNSLDPALIAKLRKRIQGKKVLITLDSCHNYEHVLNEIKAYGKMVSKGSYLIVQDTIIDEKEEYIDKYGGCPGYDQRGGPGRAVAEYVATNDDFVVDDCGEKYLLTFYPGGYLKKVK